MTVILKGDGEAEKQLVLEGVSASETPERSHPFF